MANGVYATNMEIELLKKELGQESHRLDRLKRGEDVSPPREVCILTLLSLIITVESA